MALDLEEQEQLDELKEWWTKHGNLVMGIVSVFLIAVGGWKIYHVWSANQSTKALVLFERAMQASAAHDTGSVKALTGKIMDDYGRTGYALPAAWLAAKTNFDARAGDAEGHARTPGNAPTQGTPAAK